MTNILIKLFLRKHTDLESQEARAAYGKFAGIVGIFTNLLLAAVKALIGILSGSIAVIADAFNNLSDVSASAITLIGFKLSSAPEDKEHPYGHARIEYLAGILISVFIIVLGVFLFVTSLQKALNPTTMEFSYVSLIILVVACFAKLWQMLFYKKISKLINSVTLMATATDSRNDVIATFAVLLSTIIWKFFGVNLDGIFGVFVALFIVWSGISLIRETSSPLLGEAPSEETVASIIKITKEYPDVLGIHDLMVHNYGPGKIFASIHIEVDGDKDIYETHDTVDLIEQRIKNELHINCTAHLDPIKIKDPLREPLVKLMESTLLPINGIMDIHDLRIVPGTTHTKVILEATKTSNCEMTDLEITLTAKLALAQAYPNFDLVITFDKGYI